MEPSLANVAHEFQTPLAILRGNIEILAGDGNDDKVRAARIAQATIEYLSRLIDSLLKTARESGAVELAALIREVYDDCALLAEDKNIDFVVASENVVVAGDRDRLKEVLLNLVSNALKYTPRGGRIAVDVKGVDCAEIVVEDTGIGISPENLPRIFERFYRIPGTGDVRGTGLGLHICKQIIEAHGGTISVESELGRGSRFIVRLPELHAPQMI